MTTLLVGLATVAVFVCVAYHATRAPIQRLDDRFLRVMVGNRSAAVTAVAHFFNVLGLVYVTWPIRLVIAGFLGLRRRWWHFASFVSAVVLAEISIGVLKSLYDRPRPPGALVHTTATSFPSGHAVAATVTVVAGVIAFFPEGRRRYVWGAAAVGFSVLMGLSRAYLGAHWLSDAVAGILLGTSIALATALALHAIRSRRPVSG
jgi:undecaprenyl-diphosphatase